MLTLNYREVAKQNVLLFEQLGAFKLQEGCKYHYEDGIHHCAIGICDIYRQLSDKMNNQPVWEVVDLGYIECDNLDRIRLIQALHDYKNNGIGSFIRYLGGMPTYVSKDFIPECVKEELVIRLKDRRELTPELYKHIMTRLANEAQTFAPGGESSDLCEDCGAPMQDHLPGWEGGSHPVPLPFTNVRKT